MEKKKKKKQHRKGIIQPSALSFREDRDGGTSVSRVQKKREMEISTLVSDD